MCTAVCEDMGQDVCVEMCIDTCEAMHIDMCEAMHIDMCTTMSTIEYACGCVGMCTAMSISM